MGTCTKQIQSYADDTREAEEQKRKDGVTSFVEAFHGTRCDSE